MKTVHDEPGFAPDWKDEDWVRLRDLFEGDPVGMIVCGVFVLLVVVAVISMVAWL